MPVNQNGIGQMFEKLVEQHREEIRDMLLNHLIAVPRVLKCLFLTDCYWLSKFWDLRQYHLRHGKNRDLGSHVTDFVHLLHLYFLFAFVCNFRHNLTSNSMLHYHMTHCCSKYSFELSWILFPWLQVLVYNESDAVDQSFWYFGIGMFYIESEFSSTLPKLQLEVCC